MLARVPAQLKGGELVAEAKKMLRDLARCAVD
jgi:hypothetical protein